MTRVHKSHLQHAPRRNIMNGARAAVQKKKKKPYKIVLEAVTQEKKKLHATLTYTDNAPHGFGFIPAGHPAFTEWCKEQCRQRNYDVHIVSARPSNRMHTDPEKLSHHVHRVGHHFPLEIIYLACSKFGSTYDEQDGLKEDRDGDWIAKRLQDLSPQLGRTFSKIEDKVKTSGAVRELFPKIPEADLNSIVNHAFEEGSKRVGNATELSLARRVQLAVVAHIRHVYTDYDKIIKLDGWRVARGAVEGVSLAKLKEWRDETDEQSDELEETFREIIVLDDDESGDEDPMSHRDGRAPSMEIVSSRATARDLQPETYVHDSAPTRGTTRRTIMAPRYDNSLHAFLPVQPRPHSAQQSSIEYARSQTQAPSQRYRDRYNVVSSAYPRADEQYFMQPSDRTPFIAHDNSPPRPMYRQPGSSYHRSRVEQIDGRLYNLVPIPDDEDVLRAPPGPAYRSAPQSPQARNALRSPISGSFAQAQAHSKRPSEQDLVLPSVESEASVSASPRRPGIGNPPQFVENSLSRASYIRSPKLKAFPQFQQDVELRPVSSLKRPMPWNEDFDRPIRTRSTYYAAPPQDDPVERQHASSREYIDLTCSPQRARVHEGGLQPGQYSAVPRNSAYVSMQDYRSPARELRAPYHEVPVVERSQSAIAISAMGPRPRGQYMPVTEERFHQEEPRNPRNGFGYGGHDL